VYHLPPQTSVPHKQQQLCHMVRYDFGEIIEAVKSGFPQQRGCSRRLNYFPTGRNE
jgi:hypothetical protein